MAGYFDKEQRAIIYDSADQIGNILRDRFQAKQAEVFGANELARFQADSAAFNESLASFNDPNSNDMANAFRQYQSNVVLPFMTQASMKYADNPRIMQTVQQIYKANMDGVDQYMDFRKTGIAERGVAVQEKQENRMGEAQTQEEQRADAMAPLERNNKRASTNLMNAQARHMNALTNKTDTPTTFADLLNQARNPKDPKAKFLMDTRTEQEILSRVSAKNKGQLYPSGVGQWGSDTDEDKKQALDYLRQKDLLKDVYTAGRVAALAGNTPDIAQQLADSGLNPEAVALVFPDSQFNTDNQESKARGLINDYTDPSAIVSVVTGTPQGPSSHFTDLSDFYDNVIDNTKSYKDLPPQLRSIFGAIKTNKLGNPIVEMGDVNTGEVKEIPIHSPKIKGSPTKDNMSFEFALKAAAREQISKQMVQPGSAKKEEIDQFLDKTIDKFLPEFVKEHATPAQRKYWEENPDKFKEALGQSEGFMGMLKKGLQLGGDGYFTGDKAPVLVRKSAEGLRLLYKQAKEALD